VAYPTQRGKRRHDGGFDMRRRGGRQRGVEDAEERGGEEVVALLKLSGLNGFGSSVGF
jgi:hypothetical protein